MKRLLTKTMLALTGLIGLLPATASATALTMFTFSNSSGTTGVGTATVDFSTLTYGPGNTVASGAGNEFVEQYTWNSGSSTATLTFTSTATVGIFTAGQTFLTINESGPDLLPSTSVPTAVNLYSGATSLTFNNASFQSALGVPSATPPVNILTGSASVTDLPAGTISSATTQFTITPEPATFTMLGMALLAVMIAAKKNVKSRHSES